MENKKIVKPLTKREKELKTKLAKVNKELLKLRSLKFHNEAEIKDLAKELQSSKKRYERALKKLRDKIKDYGDLVKCKTCAAPLGAHGFNNYEYPDICQNCKIGKFGKCIECAECLDEQAHLEDRERCHSCYEEFNTYNNINAKGEPNND